MIQHVWMYGTVKHWVQNIFNEWYKRIRFITVSPLITDAGTFWKCSPDLYTCKISSKTSSVLLTLCFSSPIANTRGVIHQIKTCCYVEWNLKTKRWLLTCCIHYLIHKRFQYCWSLMRQQIDEEISEDIQKKTVLNNEALFRTACPLTAGYKSY